MMAIVRRDDIFGVVLDEVVVYVRKARLMDLRLIDNFRLTDDSQVVCLVIDSRKKNDQHKEEIDLSLYILLNLKQYNYVYGFDPAIAAPMSPPEAELIAISDQTT